MHELPSNMYQKFFMPIGVAVNSSEVVQVDWSSNPYVIPDYSNQSCTWLKFQNVFAFPYSGIYYDSRIYFPPGSSESFENPQWRQSRNYTVYKVEYLLNFMHWSSLYGHFLIDYLPLVTTLSYELRLRSHVLMPVDMPHVHHLMTLFGFRDSNLHFAEEGKVYFGEHVYTTETLHMMLMFPGMITRMRMVFAKALNLDKKNPWRFVLYNRKSNRRIDNMDAIASFLCGKFPSVSFDLYRDEERMNLAPEKKWTDKMLFYNEMMFLFAIHGSGSLNAVFMQPNTVAVILETEGSWSSIFAAIAQACKLHLYTTRDRTYKHYKRHREVPLKELKLLELLEMAANKAVDLSGKWYPIEVQKTIPYPVLFSNGEIRYDTEDMLL